MRRLRLYTGNRLEQLACRIADVLVEPLSSPLEKEIIVVQSKGMEHWLSMQLAREHGVDELGLHRVGDRGEQQRDVGDVLCHRLGGRGGHRQREVQVVRGELLGDGQRGALLAVGVLLVKLGVDTGLLEGLDEPGGRGIQRGVLDQLVDADLVGLAVTTSGIVAAGAAVLLMPKESKGWYSWDPTVGEVDYTMISATPKIMDVLEDMYSIVYGELPSRETEVPASQLLEYESLVTDTATGIDVQSRSSILPLPSTFEDTVSLTDSEIQNMKIISYSSGLTDCFVSMLGEEQVWDTVVAAGSRV